MKKTFFSSLVSFTIFLFTITTAFAQDPYYPYVFDVDINSSWNSAASSDMPLYFNISGHTPGEDMVIDIERLEFDEGPYPFYFIYIEGTNVGFSSLIGYPNDNLNVTIPGEFIQEQATFRITENNRAWEHDDPDTWWKPQHQSFTFTQEVVNEQKLKVETRDHHLGNPTIYVLGIDIENIGQTVIEDIKVRYFFTTEDASVIPNVIDYYTPLSVPKLLKVPGTNDYALELDYNNLVLNPGESTTGGTMNQIHIHYPDYTLIDKFNDYSNPIPESMKHIPASVLFKVNNKVAVYDNNGNLIYGNEQPGYSKGQYVVQ